MLFFKQIVSLILVLFFAKSSFSQIIDSLCINQLESNYSVNGWPNSSFLWTIQNGEILSGQGTENIIVKWKPKIGINRITVQEKSENNCLGDEKVAFIKIKDSRKLEISGNNKVCENDEVTLTANSSENITWNTGQKTREIKVKAKESTKYYIQDDFNCGYNEFYLEVETCVSIKVYNSFTPDNDGVNDFLEIENIEFYPNSIVEIYSRWGEKLYSSQGYTEKWDGTFKGTRLPNGSYYYVIVPGNGEKQISGFINLIRK